MSKTIGIVGSRRRNSKRDFDQLMDRFLEVYEDGDKLVSGGCYKGGDKFCEIIANKYNLTKENNHLIIHKAEWDKYGKSAGFKRNTYIAEDCDVLIAIVSKDRTGGTEDTIKKAERMGKKIIILEENDYDFDPLLEIL